MGCARNGKSLYGGMGVIAKGRSEQAPVRPNYNDCRFGMYCADRTLSSSRRALPVQSCRYMQASSGMQVITWIREAPGIDYYSPVAVPVTAGHDAQ